MIDLKKLESIRSNISSNNDDPRWLGKINNIGDLFWMVENSGSSRQEGSLILNWEDRYSILPKEILILAQEIFLKRANGYTNPDTGRIVVRSDQGLNPFYDVSIFFRLIIDFFPNKKLKNITLDDLKSAILSDLDNKRRKKKEKGQLKDNTGVPAIMSYLQILREFSGAAHTLNPFSEELVLSIPSSEDFLSDYFHSKGVPWEQVLKGTSHVAIPFHISSHWLSYILGEMGSEEFQIVRGIWLTKRMVVEKRGPLIKNRSKRGDTTARLTKIIQSRVVFSGVGRKPPIGVSQSEIIDELDKCFIRLLGYKPKNSEVLRVNSQLAGLTAKYIGHLYTVIAMVTGARRSELHTLSLSSFAEVTDEVSEFGSFICKTNEGLPTIRNISGFAHKMTKECSDIGWTPRNEDNVRLFYSTRSYSPYYIDIGVMGEHTNLSYMSFLERLPEEIGIKYRIELPKVTTHQHRHTFAAFALRVSDGNVFEAVRSHFRHALGSWMTQVYFEDKVTDTERKFIEKEYISEIIKRIGAQGDHGYFGPMLVRIERLIEDKIQLLDTNTLPALSHEMAEIVDGIDSIKVHEWGFCVPQIETISKSKCWDKETKIPDYDAGSTFSNCSRCVHLLSQRSCKEDIERIAISIHKTLEHYPVLGKTLRKVYERDFFNATAMLKQIESMNNNE